MPSSDSLRELLVTAVDLAPAGLDGFGEPPSPSSDEDPPPMTAATPELTALLNRAFNDKAAREVRTSFMDADGSVLVDEGVSERAPGAAVTWMSDMRRVYTECAAWTMLTFRSVEGDPAGPGAARLAAATSRFLALAPARFLGLPVG